MASKINCGTNCFAGFIRAYSLLVGLLVMVIGFIHLDNVLVEFCDDRVQNCVGPSLVWANSDNPVADVNGPFAGGFTLGQPRWRNVFTLRPDVFLDVWSPLMFGIIMVLCHFANFKVNFIAGSWARMAFFYLFGSLFAIFGYAGNLGIITGFLCVIYVWFALVISIINAVTGAEEMTDPTFSLKITKPGFITSNSKGESGDSQC
ncbi:Transmembrane protein [Pycnococcus provasolii]